MLISNKINPKTQTILTFGGCFGIDFFYNIKFIVQTLIVSVLNLYVEENKLLSCKTNYLHKKFII